jgi:cytochrome c551
MAITLSACGGEGGGTTTAPFEPAALSAAAAAGKTVFEDNCSICHGDGLEGGVGPSLRMGSEAAGKPIAALEDQIRAGGGGMPAWGGLLPDTEISAVLAFLSEMQGR